MERWYCESWKSEMNEEHLKSSPIASTDYVGIRPKRYQALLRVARAAKLYLEHGEPELADDLEEALIEVKDIL